MMKKVQTAQSPRQQQQATTTTTTTNPSAGAFSAGLPFTPSTDQAQNLRNYQEFLLKGGDSTGGWDVNQIVKRCEVALTPQLGADHKNKSKRAGAASSSREAKRLAKAKEKEEKKAAKEAELKKKEETSKEIDKIVDKFQPDYRKCIRCQDEKHPRNKQDETDYSVAKWLILKEGKPEEKRYDIADFNHQQLRDLAAKCKLKGSGSMSMWKARMELAAWAKSGTIYSDNSIANPFTTAQEKKTNTYMRIIQTCFHPSLVQRFVDLNDRNKRKQFEQNSGQDPVKSFMVEVSNMYNDTSFNETLSKIVNSDQNCPTVTPILLNGWPAVS
ncbi:unknown protein [Seminavis robusta]|uniref:Uncharacterized protein n=1 Tax=Seminavis robusta TaxID=568900 RepID=A0A9N8HL06_9STRA|nr:unknown protein [Seminavis robusta]|eukprot:Sro790_g202810.1 n/a (328) ;mRNA; f:26830-27813